MTAHPLAFWVMSTVVTIAFHLLLQILLGRVRRFGRYLREILIVGTNARARGFAESIESRPELGYQVIGFVDEEWPGLVDFRPMAAGWWPTSTAWRSICAAT